MVKRSNYLWILINWKISGLLFINVIRYSFPQIFLFWTSLQNVQFISMWQFRLSFKLSIRQNYTKITTFKIKFDVLFFSTAFFYSLSIQTIHRLQQLANWDFKLRMWRENFYTFIMTFQFSWHFYKKSYKI